MNKMIDVYLVNSLASSAKYKVHFKCRYESKLQNFEQLKKKFIDIVGLFNYVHKQ
jgi:hypothetical protein